MKIILLQLLGNMCINVNTDAKEVEKEVPEYFRVAYLRINIFLQITTNLFKYSVHKYKHESKVIIHKSRSEQCLWNRN